nr:right-handed parallel beta-helix repeat-containing protein [Chloroflexota bacterium]
MRYAILFSLATALAISLAAVAAPVSLVADPALPILTRWATRTPTATATPGGPTATATATQPGGNVFYVATTGNDSNPGTLAQPWRTIQKAANTAAPGATVYAHGGVYHEAITVRVSGSEAGGYITFASYPGETAIVDGAGLGVPKGSTGLFLIADQSYVIVQGFEIRGYQTAVRYRVPAGLFVTGAAHHIQIRGNRVHDIATGYKGRVGGDAHGIAVYGTSGSSAIHDIVIDGNELYSLKLGSSEALVLNGNVESFEVTNNVVHDTNNIGIDAIGYEGTAPTDDQARNGVIRGNVVYNISSFGNPAYGSQYAADGIYVDGGRDIVIERNIVHHANIGIELASEHSGRATSNVTVRSNFVYRNDVMGIALGGYDTRRGSTENCAVVNNTLFHNDTRAQGNGELLLQYDTRNNVIENNIFYATNQNLLIANPFSQNTGNTVDRNLYFAPAGETGSTWQWKRVTYKNFAAYQAATGNDAHSLFADPQLSSLSAPDLHLLGTSPAIDAGEPLAVVGDFDIDGEARVQNRVELGADEVR